MDTEFPVCVPWRSDNGGVRDDLWKYTKTQWQKFYPQCPIFAVDVKGDQFRRAWAVNAAVEAAAAMDRWSVYVIADADTVMFEAYWGDVANAVARCDGRNVMCYAHDERWMLGRLATAQMISHGMIGPSNTDPETTGPHWNTFSGVTAISASLWVEVNGFDQRFEGWGFEDLAFMHACGTLGEIERTNGTVAHLWHPRKHEEEDGQPHYLDNWDVWKRYVAANGNPEAMRALIDETR